MRPSRPVRSGLIVVSVAVVLAGCASTTASPTPPPTASPPASAAASPGSPSVSSSLEPSAAASIAPAAPSATAEGWHHVPDQPALQAVQLSQIVWTGTRFVGAGMGDDGATILDSPDGLAWHAQTPVAGNAIIRGLAVGSGGLVAVGNDGSSARSWSSPDGLTWTESVNAAALSPTGDDSVSMSGVAPVGAGWLAVGADVGPCVEECGAAAIRAIVWTSSDGLRWTRQPATTALAHAEMTGVVRTGTGFVAVGGAPDHPGAKDTFATHAVVWTSTDGKAWSRVPDASLFHAPTGTDQMFGTSMQSVAVAGGRIVAVGTVGTQDDVGSALAWWSADGRHWSRGTGDRFLYGQMFSVAVVPGGFLATGPSGADSCLGGTWSSPDGAAWTCVASDPAFDAFSAYAAAASTSREVLVGIGDPSVSLGSSVWVRDVP